VSRPPRQRAPSRSLRGKQKSVPLPLFESRALSKNVGVHLSPGADILPGSTASGIDPKKCILIVVRVIATRVCVAGLGLRHSTIATSAQWRRSGANRVPISASFTSVASAFDSDVAGKAVPLGPYSRLLSGRLPQLGPYGDLRARRAVHLRPRDRRVGAPYCSGRLRVRLAAGWPVKSSLAAAVRLNLCLRRVAGRLHSEHPENGLGGRTSSTGGRFIPRRAGRPSRHCLGAARD
jgi:hypothetical protein